MISRKKIYFALIFIVTFGFILGANCLAVDIGSQLSKAGQGAYGTDLAGTTSLPAMIGSILKVVLGLLGIILVIIIVYAGYLYMIAGGEQKTVTKAKDLLRNGIIGLIIVVGAYAITNFVVSRLVGVITPTR